MPFQAPITVRNAVNRIHSREYVLPSIQRELVWDVEQITKLFDSMMRDYPIGSFLFWKVRGDRKKDFQFYEFIRDYHAKNSKHNPRANVDGTNEITAILDGQQRLTSLYIGLRGSYAYKTPRKRWTDPAAFPKRKLYLNLLKPANDPDIKYDFQFLNTEEAGDRNASTFWFEVGKVLEFGANDPAQIYTYLVEQGLATNSFAGQCLFKLHKTVHTDLIINFFEEEEQDLDKVLRIFVRINSGGTPLSYSDLLLSIATSQWKEKDAREEIHSFVDEINNIRDGFTFSKDFVLKSCLVISDFKDIAFDVNNFNAKNMQSIEGQWDEISTAIRNAVLLAASFGFNWQTLISNYALIPVAYYLMKRGADSSFVQSAAHASDRKAIRKWISIALLKQTFGGQPDNVLRPIRDAISTSHNEFPVTAIADSLKGTSRPVRFDEEEIWDLLSYQYGGRYTFLVLALLYPDLDFRNQFHQDHIFPRSFFTSRKKLLSKGIREDSHQFYLENHNYVANLQLLEGVPNQEKSNKDFLDWLKTNHATAPSLADYGARHYIPGVDLSFANFEEFFTSREHIMFDELKKLLL
jgi:uncharacterized protein with ParB-like and HNH nuclease domain